MLDSDMDVFHSIWRRNNEIKQYNERLSLKTEMSKNKQMMEHYFILFSRHCWNKEKEITPFYVFRKCTLYRTYTAAP